MQDFEYKQLEILLFYINYTCLCGAQIFLFCVLGQYWNRMKALLFIFDTHKRIKTDALAGEETRRDFKFCQTETGAFREAEKK